MAITRQPSEFLTSQEAARFLRVSAPTLRRLVRSGELPALRVGRQVRILVSDLAKLDAAERTN